MADIFAAFEITPSAEGYVLTFTTETGESIELVATFEQLDLIAEEIDRQLDSDEEEELDAAEAPEEG